MTIEENKIQNYEEAKTIVHVSIGESVKIIRELQDLSQNQLSVITGIPQSTISAIEHNRVNMVLKEQKCLLGL
jgi:DNA-binding transcriptional regulator YiaG